MPTTETTVGAKAPQDKPNVPTRSKEQEADEPRSCPSTATLRAQVDADVKELVAYVEAASGTTSYEGFEGELIKRIFELARLLIVLFLQLWQEKTRPPKRLVRHGPRR